jgi:hypothetical protein
VRPPLARPVRRAWLDGEPLATGAAGEITLARAPATLVLES